MADLLPLRDGAAAVDISDPARKLPEEGRPDRSGAASRLDSDQRILDVAVFVDAIHQLLSRLQPRALTVCLAIVNDLRNYPLLFSSPTFSCSSFANRKMWERKIHIDGC